MSDYPFLFFIYLYLYSFNSSFLILSMLQNMFTLLSGKILPQQNLYLLLNASICYKHKKLEY